MLIAEATILENIAMFVPDRAVPVEDTAPGLRLNRAQARLLRRVHGFGTVRVDPRIDLFELVGTAARRALGDVDRRDVRYLLHAHTVPTLTPPHISAAEELRARLGLERAEAFAITQQHCAGGLSALDIAGQLLRAGGNPRDRALVVVGEKRLPFLARLVARTTALGDGSAACLIGLSGAGDRILSYADRTVRLLNEGVWTSAESEREFSDGYTYHLGEVIYEAVRRAGLTLADIELVVPHNVSTMLWSRTNAALGLRPSQVYLDTVADYGHCHGADPLLNFASLRARGRLIDGGRYLLTSVGLGSTYAAMVIEHREASCAI